MVYQKLIPLGGLLLLLLLLGLALTQLDVVDISPEGIETAIEETPTRVAPFLFLGLAALRGFFFVPVSSFTIAAGLLFGPVYGPLWGLFAVFVGAMGPFFLARVFGRQHIEPLLKQADTGNLATAEAILTQKGFVGILLLRLIPFPPFDAISYLSGVSGVRVSRYAAGTTVGSLPGLVAWSLLGSALSQPLSPLFFTAIGIIILQSLSGGWLLRHLFTANGR